MQKIQVCRREEKFSLTAAQAQSCKARISQLLLNDPNNSPQGYLVTSLYFDTPAQKDYFLQQNGLFERSKLRLRMYNDRIDDVKLECKMKRGDFQQKTSLVLNHQDAEKICNGDYSILRATDPTENFFRVQFLKGYRPKLLIKYMRTAFYLPYQDIRVTFDSDIRCCETGKTLFENRSWLPVTNANEVIVEVKYNGVLPTNIRNLLAPWATSRNSYSKFGNGHKILKAGDL